MSEPGLIRLENLVHLVPQADVVTTLISKLELCVASERQPVERRNNRESRVTDQYLRMSVTHPSEVKQIWIVTREPAELCDGLAVAFALRARPVASGLDDPVADPQVDTPLE